MAIQIENITIDGIVVPLSMGEVLSSSQIVYRT